MLLSIFKQDTWDEPIVLLLMDFSIQDILKYFEELFQSGSLKEMNLELEETLAINKEFIIKHEDLEKLPTNHAKNQKHKREKEKPTLTYIEEPILKKEVEVEEVECKPYVEELDYFYYEDDFKEEIVKPKKKKKKAIIETNSKVKNNAWQYFQQVGENSEIQQCNLCKKEITSKHKKTTRLNNHLRYKHTEIFLSLTLKKNERKNKDRKLGQYYTDIPDDPAKCMCTLCNSKITRHNIMRHIQNKHHIYVNGVPPPKHLCSDCGHSFRDKSERDKHEYFQHKKSFPPEVEARFENLGIGASLIVKEFYCEDCGKKFTCKGNMKFHACEGREGTFECKEDGCGMKFFQKNSLITHSKTCFMFRNCREEVRTLTCTKCNVKFSTFPKFKQHCLQSTTCTLLERKPYQCSECSKFFTTEKRMTIHMRVHTGEMPYQCGFCLKKFKFEHRLKYHKCLQ